MLLLCAGILGALIGSFLNVIIYRFHTSLSPLEGRSQCFTCGKVLSWHELIPLLSFFVQRGRCVGCGTRISWQYPLVELLTAGIFVAVVALGKPLLETLYLLAVFSTLLVIAVYDIRHKIIPDTMVLVFALLAFVWFVYVHGYPVAFDVPAVWTILAGLLFFFPFWFLWWISEGEWIGLGDGKLALGIGWFLGPALGATALLYAFWMGAAWVLSLMGAQRLLARYAPRYIGLNLTMQSEVPFGPFLIAAVAVVYFTQASLFDGTIHFFSLFS